MAVFNLTEGKIRKSYEKRETSSSPSALFTTRMTGPVTDDGSEPGIMLSTWIEVTFIKIHIKCNIEMKVWKSKIRDQMDVLWCCFQKTLLCCNNKNMHKIVDSQKIKNKFLLLKNIKQGAFGKILTRWIKVPFFIHWELIADYASL